MTLINRQDLDREVNSLFQDLRPLLKSVTSCPVKLKYLVQEHSGFSRHNPMLLSVAADHSKSIPAISAELKRNADEEGGSANEESHFTIYTQGLQESFNFKVDEYTLSMATQSFLNTMLNLCKSDSASRICGVFYATEAGAIPELELVRDLVDSYSESQQDSYVSERLSHFFDLHLNGVEQEHKDGLGIFIDQYEDYDLNVQQIHEGFIDALATMKIWWINLIETDLN